MRKQLVPSLVLAILVAAGIGYYATRDTQESRHDSNVPLGDTDLSSSDEQSTGINSEQDKSTSLPDRTLYLEDSVAPLFFDVPESELDHQVLAGFLAARPIGAYRIVRVDSDALRTRIRESADSPEFEIRLLDAEPMPLIAEGSVEHSAGWQSGIGSWIGSVAGDETSRASFVVAPDGTVNGVVRTLKTGRIKIEPIKGTPHHIVWQWDPSFERDLD